jgi:uncharacterized membrane protein YbhN (UPF0104 family)
MTRRLLALLARNFRPLALLAAGTGLAAALWAERGGISAFPWRLSWPLFVGAVLIFGVTPLFGASAFWLLVRATTGRSGFGASVHVWMRGFVSRYVPLGALTLAVRIRARDRLGASRAQVLSATAYEQVAAIVAGAAAATLALSVSGERPPTWVFALLACVIATTAVVFALALRLRSFPSPVRLSPRAFALAALANCVGWAVAGAGAWILVAAVSPSSPPLSFMTGAYALAWLTGFVVPFAPSGLGVREATFAAILAPQFGAGPATALAVMLRFANLVGDLLVVTAVEACALATARQPGRATLSIS